MDNSEAHNLRFRSNNVQTVETGLQLLSSQTHHSNIDMLLKTHRYAMGDIALFEYICVSNTESEFYILKDHSCIITELSNGHT